ncbi:MAG: FAD-binding oxidoreductase [Oscillatoriaceae bacterium SKW80]|nr:FAD-binding oxidoreductase [Oscillatoriaceae bacterium SKW80]HIK29283.1 FAD-binding oxidoreductase [Oscillatoriaceae cyanobacterium M7585_C2015_266]
MKTYDWIVVGAGITGAALSYELAKKGFSVLLLEQNKAIANATRFSYGGIFYWSGTTELTRLLNTEGIHLHRILSDELEFDTQFRELDLLLTIYPGENSEEIAATYANCAIPPRLIGVKEACDLEPLLNPQALAAALVVRQGIINPEATVIAYCQAFKRVGGCLEIDRVLELLKQNNTIIGVKTASQIYHSANVAICAGGLTRPLLKSAGIFAKVYFTRAELLETAPTYLQLQTMVVPARLKRLQLEALASTPEIEKLWDEPERELAPPILDAGAIQLLDGRIRIGQYSRVFTNHEILFDSTNQLKSQEEITAKIANILPALGNLPASWHQCLVAFSPDRLPCIGAIPGWQGIHIFSGFSSSPLGMVPPLARRFANYMATGEDEILPLMSPARFLK